ncbi:MAG: protein-disulfide reductase DsbD family protein, partial [Lautropia sp.]
VSATLGYALIAALIGGLILNLMPCVFPVIGLKLVSFATAARGDPRVARRHAFVFGAGVVATFLVLGCALLLLRAVGDSVGWGFQLQSPTFVAALALLFVLIGLNFFGVFEAGLGLTRFGGTGPMPAGSDDGGGRQSAAASFWTGVIAVVAATPCTAPFMGSAIGFTLTSSALETLLVFAAIGVGMALPYLLLGTNGRALRWLPRPGPWLQTFRQLLAFPMFATAAWLAWVLTLQIGADGLLRLLAAAILVALVAWIYGRGQSAPRTRGGLPGYGWLTVAIVATIAALFQLVQIDGLDAVATRTDSLEVSDAGVARDGEAGRGAVASAGVSTSSMAAATHWQAWSASKVAEATRAGRTVFVDFTAAWCISCQANKKLVLERDAVTRAFRDGEVVLLRGDWTRRDPAITAELAQHGRNGVPLYLVYTPGAAAPRVLPELLTSDIVLTAIGAQN